MDSGKGDKYGGVGRRCREAGPSSGLPPALLFCQGYPGGQTVMAEASLHMGTQGWWPGSKEDLILNRLLTGRGSQTPPPQPHLPTQEDTDGGAATWELCPHWLESREVEPRENDEEVLGSLRRENRVV